ncbi:hypothetical protein LSTR_LSTR009572 [Laodelphax striatellus]|uniref:Uncharacterized protein n=1 Tax=Laodelphax striatellus TaxID=195883 RepID=A0A482WQA7_LAOST|nr:hypothetical protein LSTR_LSTR009572 [Laodelphax striatellus]
MPRHTDVSIGERGGWWFALPRQTLVRTGLKNSDEEETYQPGDEVDARRPKRKLHFTQDSHEDYSDESKETIDDDIHPHARRRPKRKNGGQYYVH